MLLTAYISATLVLALTCCFFTYGRKMAKTVALHPSRIRVMLCSSLIMGAHLLLFSKGAGLIPAVVFFPVANIAPTTVISLFGVFVFRDRLSKQQIISMIFGIVATLLLCL